VIAAARQNPVGWLARAFRPDLTEGPRMLSEHRVLAAALALTLPSVARADVAFNNFAPGDGYLGSGWVVYGPNSGAQWWTEAFRFTSAASGGVTDLVVPFQWISGDNDFSLELRADNAGAPGAVLGSFAHFAGASSGAPPTQIAADGSVQISSGATYWLVGRGHGTSRGAWHHNSFNQTGQRAYSFDGGASWSVEMVLLTAFRVEVSGGPAPCYPNCDGSTAAPILNVLDFNCFLNRFTAGASYANCDNSTSAPMLNVLDFNCFLNRFTAGCP
jgi:hypothetical protein